MTETAADLSLCSKCEKPLDTQGTPKWCRSCRAQYKREYESIVKTQTKLQGYANGVSDMREYLAKKFAHYGHSGSFSGAEIAATILRVKGPDSA